MLTLWGPMTWIKVSYMFLYSAVPKGYLSRLRSQQSRCRDKLIGIRLIYTVYVQCGTETVFYPFKTAVFAVGTTYLELSQI